MAHLFVANGKFASGNLVILCKSLQFLDRIALKDGNGKLDVGLGVFVSRLYSSALLPAT